MKELLKILLKALEVEIDKDINGVPGLCHITSILRRSEVINIDEMYSIDEYIHNNMPKYYSEQLNGQKIISTYGWEPKNLKIRREWLIKQITKIHIDEK